MPPPLALSRAIGCLEHYGIVHPRKVACTMETEYEPYIVRTSWEGTLVETAHYRDPDTADRDFNRRVKYYLNLPDARRAVDAGTCVQVIHGDDVVREWVA